MNPADIESAIEADRDTMESLTDEFRKAAAEAAAAEAIYRAKHAREWLTAKARDDKAPSDTTCTKIADKACELENMARKVAEAKANSAQEALRTLRASLSALQTLASNQRALIGS